MASFPATSHQRLLNFEELQVLTELSIPSTAKGISGFVDSNISRLAYTLLWDIYTQVVVSKPFEALQCTLFWFSWPPSIRPLHVKSSVGHANNVVISHPLPIIAMPS